MLAVIGLATFLSVFASADLATGAHGPCPKELTLAMPGRFKALDGCAVFSTVGMAIKRSDDVSEQDYVSWVKPHLWHSNQREYLVVEYGAGGEMCALCERSHHLAIIDLVDGRPILVAHKDLSGNYRQSIRLDLAPYELTSEETLIGLRTSECIPTVGCSPNQLVLLRLQGGQLQTVATIIDICSYDGALAAKVGEPLQIGIVTVLNGSTDYKRLKVDYYENRVPDGCHDSKKVKLGRLLKTQCLDFVRGEYRAIACR